MKRQHLIFLITLAAFTGSLVSIFITQLERDFQLRGYVDASQEANLPFRTPRFGVNVELTQYDASALGENLTLIRDMHATWVRQIFPWDEIELTHNHYEWETWDTIINAVAEQGELQIVAVLTYSPTWARSSGAESVRTSPPAYPKEFAEFAGDFAQRYGDVIDYYQIWDEQNLTETWGGLEPRAADYVALLREAYVAIHGYDTNAVVIGGALSPTTETGPKNISDVLYLRDMYAFGAQAYMDAVGAKPYGFSTSPLDRRITPDTLNFSRIIALREEMIKQGDSNKAVWAMNWGWNSLPDDWTGNPSIWGDVTEEEQTTYTLQALERAEREWPWLAGMILHHWQPEANLEDPVWGFSIVSPENQPTPLYQALADQANIMIATNGLYPAVNPFARYSGVWSLGDMGADIGWVQDSQLDFTFSGKNISLLLRQDNYVAYLYPTIDNQQPNGVPHDTSGNAYIVLTSGTQLPELSLVPIGKNLSNTEHNLHVVADRGWDRWALAGFAVSSGDLSVTYDRQLTVLWLTLAFSTLGVVVAGRQIDWKRALKPPFVIAQTLNKGMQLLLAATTSLALLVGMLLTFGESTPHVLRREPMQIGLAIVSAGLIYIEPGVVLTIAACLVLFVLIYNQLALGLMLTIFWAPFFLFPVELYRFAFPMAEILILLTACAWVVRGIVTVSSWQKVQNDHRTFIFSLPLNKLTALDYGVIAWALLGLVSLLWVEHHEQAVTQFRTMIVEPTLFYTIFRTSVRRQQDIVKIVDAMVLAGFVVAIIGLWQFVQGESVITAEDGARRLASVYGSPNNVGLFLGRCIPFALAYVLSQGQTRRIIAGVVMAFMGLAVLLSQGVGAIFIGVPFSVVAVIVFSQSKHRRLILVALAALVMVAFVISLQSERFSRVLQFDSGTNFYRIRVWQSALNVIRDNPITGLGLDQFLYAFRGHYIMPDAWQEPNLSHPHNQFLDFWVSLGFGGLVLYIALMFLFWRDWRHAFMHWKGKNWVLYSILVGAAASMVNQLAHGMIDNSVYVQDLCYVFVLLLAISCQLSNVSAIDEPPI